MIKKKVTTVYGTFARFPSVFQDIWGILHFLVIMSNTPAIDTPIQIKKYTIETKDEAEIFDWGAYLMQGVELDHGNTGESSDEVKLNSAAEILIGLYANNFVVFPECMEFV
jgi:hypothetical protein